MGTGFTKPGNLIKQSNYFQTISRSISSNPEAAKPPLIGDEAVEQPNSKQVWGRGAENVTGEARRVLWVVV